MLLGLYTDSALGTHTMGRWDVCFRMAKTARRFKSIRVLPISGSENEDATLYEIGVVEVGKALTSLLPGQCPSSRDPKCPN